MEAKKMFFLKIINLSVISLFCFTSCLGDIKYYENKSIGVYSIQLNKSKIGDSLGFKTLVLELKSDNSYFFSEKLPFIDQKGNWEIEGKGEVRYISLITKEKRKDRVSICCDENNEITLHCYLDKSNQFKRIIFKRHKRF